MLPVGYMYKRVVKKPDWIKSEFVKDVYSLSHCVSDNFADYINFWKHNGYWLFDSPQIVEEIARGAAIDLAGTTLFYYEAYDYEYDDGTNQWIRFTPEPSFPTNVQIPRNKNLEGFDVTTFSQHTSPECSPLSCNSLATDVPVNKHCLFRTFAEAKEALENSVFSNSGPGPYRVFAVYTVAIQSNAA